MSKSKPSATTVAMKARLREEMGPRHVKAARAADEARRLKARAERRRLSTALILADPLCAYCPDRPHDETLVVSHHNGYRVEHNHRGPSMQLYKGKGICDHCLTQISLNRPSAKAARERAALALNFNGTSVFARPSKTEQQALKMHGIEVYAP